MIKLKNFIMSRPNGFNPPMDFSNIKEALFEDILLMIYGENSEVYKSFLENKRFNIKLETNMGNINYELRYNPEVDFDYYTSKSCRCDGTYMFMLDLVNQVMDNVLWMKTCNTSTLPSDFNTNPSKYKVIYTVGNFVTNEEYGDEFGTEEKPWMKSRFTVMLPIKTEYIKLDEYVDTYVPFVSNKIKEFKSCKTEMHNDCLKEDKVMFQITFPDDENEEEN